MEHVIDTKHETVDELQAVRDLGRLAAEDLSFYNQGLKDFTSNNRDTDAAKGYIAFWSEQPSEG